MTAIITMDSAGRFVLPKAMRDRLDLRAGSRLRVDIVGDNIELTPESDEGVKLVRKGKMFVITGIKGTFDAVEGIKAAREEREEDLARRLREP